MYKMWYRRLINKFRLRFGLKRDTLFCMRQANTYVWPSHLGAMTPGTCEKCQSSIYFEKQNWPFHKICHVCAFEHKKVSENE